MDIGCQDWMKRIRPKMPEKLGRILDVGSLDINGSAKEYFQGFSEYLGIDMQEGNGVDVVMNAHDIPARDKKWFRSFDVVICMNTFEHDNKFWISLQKINDVIKPGGYFIFASPTTGFPVHNHPSDYYRFLEPAVKEIIFEGYHIVNIETVYSKKVEDTTHRKGWRGVNPIICGLGQKI